jgi:signal transduction histidine kinase
VKDTGVGISSENMKENIYAFFHHQERPEGGRLGLAISYGIIQRHHGKIEIMTKEGEGTTFKVYLPVSHEEDS